MSMAVIDLMVDTVDQRSPPESQPSAFESDEPRDNEQPEMKLRSMARHHAPRRRVRGARQSAPLPATTRWANNLSTMRESRRAGSPAARAGSPRAAGGLRQRDAHPWLRALLAGERLRNSRPDARITAACARSDIELAVISETCALTVVSPNRVRKAICLLDGPCRNMPRTRGLLRRDGEARRSRFFGGRRDAGAGGGEARRHRPRRSSPRRMASVGKKPEMTRSSPSTIRVLGSQTTRGSRDSGRNAQNALEAFDGQHRQIDQRQIKFGARSIRRRLPRSRRP